MFKVEKVSLEKRVSAKKLKIICKKYLTNHKYKTCIINDLASLSLNLDSEKIPLTLSSLNKHVMSTFSMSIFQ